MSREADGYLRSIVSESSLPRVVRVRQTMTRTRYWDNRPCGIGFFGSPQVEIPRLVDSRIAEWSFRAYREGKGRWCSVQHVDVDYEQYR